MATQPGGSVTSRAASECRSAAPGSSSGAGASGSGTAPAKFRHGLLQLMIHTIDPLHDGKLHFVHFVLLILYIPIGNDMKGSLHVTIWSLVHEYAIAAWG